MPDLEFLGVDPLTATNALVAEAWAMASNGMGGIDWSALPFIVQWLQIDDVEGVIEGLMQIKTHRPASSDAAPMGDAEPADEWD